jgi:hypothetical protein
MLTPTSTCNFTVSDSAVNFNTTASYGLPPFSLNLRVNTNIESRFNKILAETISLDHKDGL